MCTLARKTGNPIRNEAPADQAAPSVIATPAPKP